MILARNHWSDAKVTSPFPESYLQRPKSGAKVVFVFVYVFVFVFVFVFFISTLRLQLGFQFYLLHRFQLGFQLYL